MATATAAALFGLKCQVYMGEEDVRRQKLNVFKMKAMGTEVVPVESGSRTLGRDQRGDARLDGDGRDRRTTSSAASSARTVSR